MRSIRVGLGARSYPVLVGRGLIRLAGRIMASRGVRGTVVAVTSAPVLRRYGAAFARSCRSAGLRVAWLKVPDGESAKTPAVAEHLLRAMARLRCGRDSCVAALGGGTVGDVAGFAASVFTRGVALVQVPTTLVAQVDAAIGGKTGVDLPEGKNLVGTFHQPLAVITDPEALRTLPRRHLRAGLAEVVKYGVILSPRLFSFVERNGRKLLAADPRTLEKVVAACSALKARVVSRDEKEAGLRAILNFGHTAGHAIEAAQRYSGMLHGEAVAVGMACAARISERLRMCPRGFAGRLEKVLRGLGLPVRPPSGLSRASFLGALMRDKKRKGSRLRVVLTRGMGDVTLSGGVEPRMIMATLGVKGGS